MRCRHRLTASALALAIVLPGGFAAGPARAGACDAAEHRQFDFWLGQWDVETAKGIAGHNRIEAIQGGCALSESWTGSGGFTGQSLNAYDRVRGVWQQVWIGADGLVLNLVGGLEDGRMVLRGEAPEPQGSRPVPQRITWTPNTDGTVRQHWEISRDGGSTWETLFDGRYRRRADAPPAP